MIAAKIIPSNIRRGVTMKSNMTSENVTKFPIPVEIPFIGSAITQPSAPPRSASARDSIMNENRMFRRLNPSTRRVAISRVRYEVEAYIVFITANDDPIAMMTAIRYPRILMGKALEVCDSKYSRSEEHTSELQSRGHLVCR